MTEKQTLLKPDIFLCLFLKIQGSIFKIPYFGVSVFPFLSNGADFMVISQEENKCMNNQQ